MGVDFLKKAEEQLKEQMKEMVETAEEQELSDDPKTGGWIDTEELMDNLRQVAEEMLYERDPSLKEKIEKFKEQYSEIYVYFFDEHEFYIYRPITRFEYKDVISTTNNAEEAGEQIVLKAVLYPSLTKDRLDSLKAGIVPTLLELILNVSNFGIQNPVIKL